MARRLPNSTLFPYTTLFRSKGEEMMQAVIDASTMRLRPILMTTGAMVLGALPLARAVGAGAESRTPIGLVIVGGLDRKSTRLNSSHVKISYAVFCLKKKRIM